MYDKLNNTNKEHVITIMATSNSLLESKQWKSRSNKFWYEESGIIIEQLSSARDSEYNKMDDNDLKVRGIDPYFFNTTIPQLQKLGQPEDVRIIFWFDN